MMLASDEASAWLAVELIAKQATEFAVGGLHEDYYAVTPEKPRAFISEPAARFAAAK